ncbi:MAG: ferrous iron transport protein A [Oscillospiraceae bacterium]|nr:ferrous iron transport protein A [Oscillospiraceae bacterium]
MGTEITLDRLSPGKSAWIKDIQAREPIARRLTDLGFVKGGRVRCRMRSAAGDPTAYQIRGMLIALRRQDAARITVLPAADPWD